MRLPGFIVSFVAWVCMVAPHVQADPPTASPTFCVAGYLPNYRLAAFDLELAKGLTDLIIFSAELKDDGSLDLSRLPNFPSSELLRFRSQNQVRLWLAVGGWGRSSHFASVATSPEKRARCARSLAELCVAKGLDGIDLDWEHPQGVDEEQAYGELLREIRDQMSKRMSNRRLMLSVTIGPWQRIPDVGLRAVDRVQIMAYDNPGKHSTFEQTQQQLTSIIDAGVPAEKLVLGVPFYGRDTKTRAAMSYGRIEAKFKPDPSVDQVGGLYFNGPDMIRRKVQWAAGAGLGGVMVWEPGQDASGQPLLGAILETIGAQVHPVGSAAADGSNEEDESDEEDEATQ